MGKLNDAAIRSAKAGEIRRDLADGDGLYLRVEPTGRKVFYARSMLAKKVRMYRLGEYPAELSLAEARTANAAHRAEVAKARAGDGPDPASARKERKQATTLAAFAEDVYLPWAERKKRSWLEDQRILSRDVLPFLGSLRVRDIDRKHVASVVERIERRGSFNAAWQCLKLVRRLLALAVEKGVIEANPAAVVRTIETFTPKDRVLSELELSALLRVLPAVMPAEQMHLALLLQIHTLCRPSEAREAMRGEFDKVRGIWTIPAARSKNGVAHIVPITHSVAQVIERAEAAADTLAAQRGEEPSPFLFPGKLRGRPVSEQSVGRAITRDFKLEKSTLRAADIEPFTPHDLRRTGATHLARLGHGPIVPMLLNHTPQGVTRQHYDLHDYLPERRAALEVWSSRLEGLKVEQTADGVKITAIRSNFA
ncbi:MAG: tyrosine-type recombinase/integrase [Methyloversatilis sp.]|uniref:tyrosine-type recombinase/integrase n=1 Tax=Methyloversatilis sp. TaxID=2569862 RepID=UPI0027352FA1|nr:site-specific integrase [Methyloversatilis sp.]MDP3871037.1 tyrosine-type recombinase/integrase [Methyloversatilis sp.]